MTRYLCLPYEQAEHIFAEGRYRNGNITSLLGLTKNSILLQALTQCTDGNNISNVSAQSASLNMRTIHVLNEQTGTEAFPVSK
jgi:hypothetical protein